MNLWVYKNVVVYVVSRIAIIIGKPTCMFIEILGSYDKHIYVHDLGSKCVVIAIWRLVVYDSYELVDVRIYL